MDTNNIIAEIKQIIKQELDCISKLDDLLMQEQSSIKTSNSDQLKDVLILKNEHIIKLQELDSKRNQVLTCNSITPTVKVFNELIDNSNSDSLKSNWVLLREKLQECKSNNELNGRLIHMKKNTNESILKILLGNRQVSSETYSPTGKTGIYSRSGLSAVV